MPFTTRPILPPAAFFRLDSFVSLAAWARITRANWLPGSVPLGASALSTFAGCESIRPILEAAGAEFVEESSRGGSPAREKA